jgi:hypothetical protein
LESRLSTLRRFDNGEDSESVLSEIERCKSRLDDINRTRLEGLFVRARLDRELLDEKCSNFFFSRIRQRRTRADIRAVRGADGQVYDTQADIGREYRGFFADLYSPCGNVEREVRTDFLAGLPPSLEPEDSVVPRVEEGTLREVLYGMDNNKTPGPDGLSVEFYKAFYSELAPLLAEVFNEIIVNQSVPESMKDSVVVLLNKAGDQLDMANKRPISLLNVDYKLFTTYLGKTVLSKTLGKFIASEQLCGVKGRAICDGLCLMRDVIDYYRPKTSSCCAVSLDQRKAFDMVDRPFLMAAMERLGYGADFINILSALYSDTGARVQVNGFLSDRFSVGRGVRQGCPISPLLYTIYVESLLIQLKTRLGGIPVCGRRVKVSAYADDIVVFSHQLDINKIFSVCQSFTSATGSEVNVNKTRILPFPGSIVNNYSVSTLKYLGVDFSFESHRQVVRNNVRSLLGKVDKRTSHLSTLNISLKGRAFLVNTLLAPVFFHLSLVYVPGSADLKAIRKKCFGFLWGEGKPEVLKRTVLEAPVCSGGLAVVKVGEKLRSLYFHANLCRMVEGGGLGEDNSRQLLFQYNFGDRVRAEYPGVYDLRHPHVLVLAPAYKPLYEMYCKLKTQLSALAPAVPTASQVCEWLVGESAFIELSSPPGPWERSISRKVYESLHYGRVPTKVSDFIWRSVRGALKTGSVVARFKMPNLKVNCIFCDSELETVCHLFLFCPVLRRVRDRLLSLADELVGRSSAERDILFLVTGLSPSTVDKDGQIFLTVLVGSVNRAVWTARNDLLFSRSASFNGARFMYQLESIIQRCQRDYGSRL